MIYSKGVCREEGCESGKEANCLIDSDVARTGERGGKFLPRSFNVVVNVTSTTFHYEARDGDNVGVPLDRSSS